MSETTKTRRKPRMQERFRRYWAKDELAAAREFAARQYDLQVDGENLDDDEVEELRDLVEKVTSMPESMLDPRESLRLNFYIDGLNGLRERFPQQADQIDTDIKELRQLGRFPGPLERKELKQGVSPVELRGRRRGRSAVNLAAMTEEEITRMQSLIEKAAGKVGHFAELMTNAKIAILAAKATSYNEKPVKPPLPGGVVLPVEVFNDVCPPPPGNADDPNVPELRRRYLMWADVSVLWAVVAVIQSGRVPLGSKMRLEQDGGDEVLVFDAQLLWWSELDGRIQHSIDKSMTRLKNAKWLDVEQSAGIYRVKYGARARKFGLGDGAPKASASAATIETRT